MSLLRKITGLGISYAESKSEKRNIILTNYISLVATAATLLLLIGREFFAHVTTSIIITLLEGSFFFLIPIILNFLGYTIASRLLLCWAPSLFQLFSTHEAMREIEIHETSHYVGLRLFLVAFSAFPFLVFDLRKKGLLIIGLLGPLLSIVLYDPILNYLGVGYHQVGLHDESYNFNNVRAFVSFLIIAFSTYFLKSLVLKNEELNESLLAELEEKNKVIRQQAEERLRASEHKFAKIFQQNPDLMVITRESDLVIYDVNDKAYSVMGYKREELLGRASNEFTFFVHDADRKQFFDQYALHGKAETECLWRKKDGKNIYVHIASRQMEIDGERYFASVIKDISDRKVAEQEKESALYSLNERMKELTTLYKTSQILQQEKKPVEEILQELVEILPPGWQYPEITAARITIDGRLFETKNFVQGIASQSQWFDAGDGRGLIEIVYLENRKPEVEGPFLAEERKLINMIAEMLRVYFVHKHEAEELDKAEANLYATINNTEIFIWSVDRQFELLSFNQPFAKYINGRYNIDIESGTKILGTPTTEDLKELEKKWASHYIRVLAGEKLKFEEHRAGIDFQYSLNPIMEGDHITGISVFAENITERKIQDKELADANKKVADLKLMALRSVMSPHFIFNVLNAIQYYIAKNDRLNAINYLSTFSKLVRSILTHSVSNKITLSEEIEMLKNYINLEMIRFENKFDFHIEVINQVDVDNIEIPSLLIQPYVENAILHGLYNKNEKGTLSIRIKEEDDVVIFEIEDNGVGRDAAKKIRQQNFPSHKSMGIKLTEERLKLINNQHVASFEIEDLKDGLTPKGTKVTIRITI